MDFGKLNETNSLMDGGVWMFIDCSPATEEEAAKASRIKLRHPLSETYQEIRRKEESIYRKRHGIRAGKELTEEQSMEVGRKAMSKGLILDWENLTDGGEVIAHSEAEAYERLGNILFLQKILALAGDEENYDRENLEILAGN